MQIALLVLSALICLGTINYVAGDSLIVAFIGYSFVVLGFIAATALWLYIGWVVVKQAVVDVKRWRR